MSYSPIFDAAYLKRADKYVPPRPLTPPSPDSDTKIQGCPRHFRAAYLAAQDDLSLGQPRPFIDMTEESTFRQRNAFESSLSYMHQYHAPPKTIEGLHWRTQRRLAQQDQDWMMFLPDGTRVQFQTNEFGEELPVVPKRIRPGVLACDGMVMGHIEEERTGWLGQSKMLKEEERLDLEMEGRQPESRETLLRRFLGWCSGL